MIYCFGGFVKRLTVDWTTMDTSFAGAQSCRGQKCHPARKVMIRHRARRCKDLTHLLSVIQDSAASVCVAFSHFAGTHEAGNSGQKTPAGDSQREDRERGIRPLVCMYLGQQGWSRTRGQPCAAFRADRRAVAISPSSGEISSAVFPALFFTKGLAPHSNKSAAVLWSVLAAARCSGVYPWLFSACNSW